MMGTNKLVANLTDFLFEYETPRMVTVRNRRIGVIFRSIQLGVLAYIIGWVFIYEKGYQSTDSTISSVSVKVKGIGFTNLSNIGPKVLDVVDYTFPSQGSDSFVVMTNYIITPKQTMTHCTQHQSSGVCESDSDCTAGEFSRYGQGIMNGKCLVNPEGNKTCEVFGWCPAEDDHHVSNPPLLMAAENFTIFIKNAITFTAFGVTRRNIVESVTKRHLKNCTYHKIHDPFCPVFRLGYIVKEIEENFSTLAYKGGMIGIVIDWDCDLDWSEIYCKPYYSFHQLYGGLNKETVSAGFNFRYAKYYVENGTEMRDLYKVYGIRFDIMVHGKAGKFNIIPTVTTIGSGIGVFGVATLVCDLILLHVLPKRNYYKQKKFKTVEGESSAPTPAEMAKEKHLPWSADVACNAACSQTEDQDLQYHIRKPPCLHACLLGHGFIHTDNKVFLRQSTSPLSSAESLGRRLLARRLHPILIRDGRRFIQQHYVSNVRCATLMRRNKHYTLTYSEKQSYLDLSDTTCLRRLHFHKEVSSEIFQLIRGDVQPASTIRLLFADTTITLQKAINVSQAFMASACDSRRMMTHPQDSNTASTVNRMTPFRVAEELTDHQGSRADEEEERVQEAAQPQEEVYGVFTCSTQSSPLKIEVEINGVPVSMEVDTGAS
uniref:P2X purinoceptor 1 n=1 Tax=Pristiophorus japonicus TaxID=55135 RepID=UPI00398E6E09